VAAHNRAAARPALPAPDDADEEEIELEDDTHSDLPGDFVQGPRGRRRTAVPVIDAAAAAADPRRHGCPGKIGSAVLRPRESP